MPIYDNDGTASHAISVLYDHDGAFHQIGKVYDHNGTTSSLIYQREYIIIGDSRDYTGSWPTVQGAYANGGSITNSGTSILQTTSATSYGSVAGSANARSGLIDLTGYSKLYFTVSGISYVEYGRVGLSQTVQSGSALENNDYFFRNGAVYKTSKLASFTANGTYSIDVSGLTGSWYIYLGLIANYTSGNGQGKATYSNMYLI